MWSAMSHKLKYIYNNDSIKGEQSQLHSFTGSPTSIVIFCYCKSLWANNNYTVVNKPVLVQANKNIKVPVDLKLKLRRHTSALIFTLHLMYLNVSEIFFIFNNYFFFTGTSTKNQLDDSINCNIFLGL